MGEQKDKMLAGELYVADDPELLADHRRACAWLDRYNVTNTLPPRERHALLAEILAEVGEGCDVRPPLHFDYGTNIELGDGVFLNFGCVLLDVARIRIGAGTQVGPGVRILTADHPRDAGVAGEGARVRASCHHRRQCLDRGGRDHPSRRHDRGRSDRRGG